ncbi:MAG: MFS transporter [Pseudomonadota bacterium]
MTRSFFGLLLILSTLGEIATGAYLPVMPLVVEGLDLSISAVQASVASFLFAFALAQILLGPLSDRVGRRPVVLGGLAVFGLGSILVAIANDPITLVGARAVQGVGAAAGYIVSRAMLRDVSSRDTLPTRMSLMMLAFAGAVLVAPLIGSAVVLSENWRILFVVSAVLATLVLAWSTRSLAETLQSSALRAEPLIPSLLKGYIGVFRSRTYTGYVLTHSFGYGCLYIFLSSFPLIAADVYALQPAAAGPWMTLTFMGLVVGLIAARALAARLGAHGCIMLGVGLIATNAAILAGSRLFGDLSLHALVVCQIVLMIGGGLVAPNTTSMTMLLFPDRSGLAAAGLGVMAMAIAALGVWLVGLIYAGNLGQILLLQSGFAFLSVTSFLTTHGTSRMIADPHRPEP